MLQQAHAPGTRMQTKLHLEVYKLHCSLALRPDETPSPPIEIMLSPMTTTKYATGQLFVFICSITYMHAYRVCKCVMVCCACDYDRK